MFYSFYLLTLLCFSYIMLQEIQKNTSRKLLFRVDFSVLTRITLEVNERISRFLFDFLYCQPKDKNKGKKSSKFK